MQQRVSHLDRARLALQLPSLQYDTVRDNAVQLGTVRYSTVPCSTAPYRTGYSSAPLLPKRTRRERLPPHLYPPMRHRARAVSAGEGLACEAINAHGIL
jgi:hypothetical protein